MWVEIYHRLCTLHTALISDLFAFEYYIAGKYNKIFENIPTNRHFQLISD